MSTENLPAVSGDQVERKALEILNRFPPARYIHVTPAQSMVTLAASLHADYMIVPEVVEISPNPDDRDVFVLGQDGSDSGGRSNLLALAKKGVLRLSNAAAVSWSQTAFPIISDLRVVAQAMAHIARPDGQVLSLPGTKEIDLKVIERKTRAQKEKAADNIEAKHGKDPARLAKWYKRDKWIEEKVQAAMLAWEEHKVRRAETGAMLAAVRGILSLPHAFRADQLKGRAFVVYRIQWMPKIEDPVVRLRMIEKGREAMMQLYGLPGEVEEAQVEEIEPAPVEEGPAGPVEEESQPTPEEDDQVLDFKLLDLSLIHI